MHTIVNCTRRVIPSVAIAIACSLCIQAQVPDSIAVQGYLTDSEDVAVPGPIASIDFALYDAVDAVAALWSETQAAVPIADGIFNAYLGASTTLADVAFDKPLWLGVAVTGESEMEPRTPLVSVPFAFNVRHETISFLARLSSNSTPTGPTGGMRNVIFDVTDHNLGEGYNVNTGKFTAPVDGLYHFSYTVSGIPNTLNVLWWTNLMAHVGSSYIPYTGFSKNNFETLAGSASVSLMLSAGDEAYIQTSVALVGGDASEVLSYFSGYLVPLSDVSN